MWKSLEVSVLLWRRWSLELVLEACRWVWVCSIADERWGLRADLAVEVVVVEPMN
jgi:hypothetical protein